jgi:hypothetical protein
MAADGSVQISTFKSADDPRLLQSTPAGAAAALQNGAVDHITSKETQQVKLATSQRAVTMSAETSPPSLAVMAATAAAGDAVTVTRAAPGHSQRAAQAEPPLQPQLLQRMQSLKEALDSQSMREPQRGAALRAFSTLCLACSPAAQASDSQVRAEDHRRSHLPHSHV